jgi:CBS domain-containing protein
VGVGLIAGLAAAILTSAVYLAEDAFGRLPIHWMWWPAIGGLIIGTGGVVFPEALGVGYGEISALLNGDASNRIILGIIVIKSFIWAGSLGSGTSGGVLAPLLMIGGAVGGLEAGILPSSGNGFWPMLSMGAVLAGTMRSPFTGVIFIMELTHDLNALLPLLVAATVAYGFTVLVLKRSILTEKVARRGYHLSREYAVDPLEIIFVREVMRTGVVALQENQQLSELAASVSDRNGRRPRLYSVADASGAVVGVITRRELTQAIGNSHNEGASTVSQVMNTQPVVAYPDESLRVVAYRMAATGLTRLPVISANGRLLQGMVSLDDLLKGRVHNLEAEARRERIFKLPRLWNHEPGLPKNSAGT